MELHLEGVNCFVFKSLFIYFVAPYVLFIMELNISLNTLFF